MVFFLKNCTSLEYLTCWFCTNWQDSSFFFFFLIIFIYFYFLAASGSLLLCEDSPDAASQGYCSWQSTDFSLQGTGFGQVQPQLPEHRLSTVARGLSCSSARGILLDQELNPRPLQWQVDSYPRDHWEAQDCSLTSWYTTKPTTLFSPCRTE